MEIKDLKIIGVSSARMSNRFFKLLSAVSPVINASNIPIQSRMIIYSHIQNYFTDLDEEIRKMEKRIQDLETRFNRNPGNPGNPDMDKCNCKKK